jgi:hypothetical protein
VLVGLRSSGAKGGFAAPGTPSPVIHLDTSFLIRALVRDSPEDERLRAWLGAGKPLAMSAVAWATQGGRHRSLVHEAQSRSNRANGLVQPTRVGS